MDMGGGYRVKGKVKGLNIGDIEIDSDTLLVIKLTDSWVLKIIARSFLLALVIVTLPLFGPVMRGTSSNLNNGGILYGSNNGIDFELLNSVFEDLVDEGLFENVDRPIIMSHGMRVGLTHNLETLNGNEIDVVLESDLEGDGYIADETVDFAFISSIENARFIDRVMKTGGILALELKDYSLIDAFLGQFDYEIVYLRRLSLTILALRKISSPNDVVNSSTRRWILAWDLEAKKAALKGLEDVWLEPPRRALLKSKKYIRNFKYLPDLLGDSLKGYRRRIFINVGSQEEQRASLEWFNENYPTRHQDFNVYNLEMATEGSSAENGVSDWLMKNIKKGDYVVMKAEAEAVEQMVERKTISLVDEVFLECRNEWQDGGANKSKRAYWECLALYGRLRDEGVAVHQWWN